MESWRQLTRRVVFPSRRQSRPPRTTTLLERLIILAMFVFATVEFVPWWARLLFALGSIIAVFNVVMVVVLMRRG